MYIMSNQRKNRKSSLPGDQVLPSHENRVHPLLDQIAQVTDFRDPLEVRDLREKSRRLRGDRQEVEQEIPADLEAEIDSSRPHPRERFETRNEFPDRDRSVLVLLVGKRLPYRVVPHFIEEARVKADRQDPAREKELARLPQRFGEPGQEEDRGRVENRVERLVEIRRKVFRVSPDEVNPRQGLAPFSRSQEHPFADVDRVDVRRPPGHGLMERQRGDSRSAPDIEDSLRARRLDQLELPPRKRFEKMVPLLETVVGIGALIEVLLDRRLEPVIESLGVAHPQNAFTTT